ncbi:four helix bundle protein [Lebetimonas sp. JH369]|uniref:four helix bundle protein n=1 Tax=Lebetimonas sp. JH369 TaxID=990069 RepID=UPI000466FA99|nr:four helix bundle protein [Lebetimonas sp. JH369]
MGNFRELNVWQKSKSLVVDIYYLTNKETFKRDFSLKDQMRRSAVSIPSNIAEGDERNSNKESIRFLYIANGSVAELITQITIAYEINYIAKKEYKVDKALEDVSKMIKSLINYRSKNI